MILGWLLLSLAVLEVEDYYRIESAGEPAISPDGRFVAFTRRTIDEEENRRRSELWLGTVPESAEVEGEKPRRITFPGFDASGARFSPDGKWLTFRSSRPNGDAPSSSIWFFKTDALGEAFQVEGVDTMPVFSSDGKRMAFSKKTPTEKTGSEPSDREKKIEGRFSGQMYDWLQFRFDGHGYLPDPTDPSRTPPEEIYIADVEGDTFSEARRVSCLGVDVSGVAWSPDGAKLVVVADSHQRDEYDYERADLWLVDPGGTTCAGERLTDGGYEHDSPVFSPDGSRIAFRRSKGLTLLIEEKADRGAPVDVYLLDLKTRR